MLNTKLTKSILHTTDNYIKALEKAGILTVKDLIHHFPRDYDDRTHVLTSFSLINIKEKNTILVKLLTINTTKTGNNKLLTKAVLEDKNGFLSEAVWFNRKFLASQLASFSGHKVLVSGKVKYAFGKVTFQSPEVETDLSKVSGEIVPIYSDLNYIPSKWIIGKIELIKNYIKDIKGSLPENIVEKYGFISRAEAIYKIHFPKNKNDIELAKYRLAYEELFDINYRAIASKFEKFENTTGKAISIKLDAQLIKDILKHIPFDLTDHQKIALFQILKDMEKPHSMQRLLEGDVGTGKTIIALISAIHGVINSKQSPLLNPLTQSPLPNPLTQSPHPNPLPQGIPLLSKAQFTLIPKGERTGKRDILLPLPLGEEGGEGFELKGTGKRDNITYCQKEYNLRYIISLSKELRKNSTNAENALWEVLRNRKLNGIKFRRQHPFGRYIADFYSDELKLVIELDGEIHENRQEYDKIRDEIISKYQVSILRFKNEQVFNNLDKILNTIIPYIPLPLGEVRGGLGIEKGEVRGGLGIEKGEVRGGLGIEKINSKIQVAFMAPTEILARQHFDSIQKLLFEFGLKSNLLVGSTTAKQKKQIKEDLKTGNIDIIVGTHALVQEDVLFKNLGYVIIDEQHRFGVKQREILESGLGNSSGIIPHSLNMTATPIPRTLALTLYGDQDLSVISQYPKGRKEIITKVSKNDNSRHQIELLVRNEVEKGRQVFWISPLVEESEKIDLANTINTYENLNEIFFPFKVGLLHGKMKASEKKQIMQDFSDNKIQILSATSVIEVGIDIPNATIMCIEGAERFGLSQLHQFRGRVGRGKYQSYCYLFPSKGQYTDRLRAMERTNNGFELSEVDLELRGPGEVYGLRQSGIPDLKIADLKDLELISQIREDIEELFEN